MNIMPCDAIPETYFCLVTIIYNNMVGVPTCDIGATLAPHNLYHEIKYSNMDQNMCLVFRMFACMI